MILDLRFEGECYHKSVLLSEVGIGSTPYPIPTISYLLLGSNGRFWLGFGYFNQFQFNFDIDFVAH